MKKVYLMLLTAATFSSFSQTTPLLNNVNPFGGVSLNDSKVVFVLGTGQIGSTDGVTTQMVNTVYFSSGEAGLLNNKVVFVGNDGVNGNELWMSDGTTAGTSMIKNINPTGDANPMGGDETLIPVGNLLYFTADDGVNGRELWKTDGTAAGTVMVKDIVPGAGSPAITLTRHNGQQSIGNTLFFFAGDGVNGRELWKTDGTAAGTMMVKDIRPGITSTNFASTFARVGSTILFVADDGVNGAELWRSDGTNAGTYMLQNINTGGHAFNIGLYWNDFDFFSFNGYIYFNPYTGVPGNFLYKTDGTVLGTTIVANLDPLGGYGMQLTNSAIIGSKFYFGATGTGTGFELWGTDGSTLGTNLVKDISPGTSSSDPRILLPNEAFGEATQQFLFQSNKFFLMASTASGTELWISDGTTAGTQVVKDINPGTGSAVNSDRSEAYFHTLYKFYFSANDGVNGEELWVTDGTSAGTNMVQQLRAGTDSTHISFWGITSGNTLIFQADNGDGVDIYKINAAVVAFPITLTQFTAQLNGKHVQLNWKTEREINFSHFNIQRSVAGVDFANIATINGGATNYTYLDKQPNNSGMY